MGTKRVRAQRDNWLHWEIGFGSPGEGVWAAGGLGLSGLTGRLDFAGNGRFLGLDRQTCGTRGPAVGSVAPMVPGRREARLFGGDKHGDTLPIREIARGRGRV